MAENFADRFLGAVREKKSPLIVGLDPRLENLPPQLKALPEQGSHEAVAEAFLQFNKQIIDAVADIVPAVKPQIAFYEQYGRAGIEAFQYTVDHARKRGLLVIEDGKRNDIGSTAVAYADGHLGTVDVGGKEIPNFDVDCITVNPYLGWDGVTPFADYCEQHGKGIFVLCKTSNPSSGDFQDRQVSITDEESALFRERLSGMPLHSSFSNGFSHVPLYALVGLKIDAWGQASRGNADYSPIGAVVGATYPIQAKILRRIMPHTLFLVPGYGAQGGKAEDLPHFFDKEGMGAGVNSSRGIIFAYQNDPKREFADAARAAALHATEDIVSSLKKAGKWFE